jgi:hypothetical protein
MRRANAAVVVVALAVLLSSACVFAQPIYVDADCDGVCVGSRTTPEASGVIGNGGYAPAEGGFSIRWDITYDYWTGRWRYAYTFGDADLSEARPLVSHFITEVSPSITAENLTDKVQGQGTGDANVSVLTEYLETWEPGDPGNPGLPNDLYGLKFDSSQTEYIFYSVNPPVWGHFYVKSGNANAYNAGLDSDTKPGPGTMDFTPWVPTPDTGSNTTLLVPEPSSLVLLGVGLSALASRRRRRRRKAA